MSATLTEFLLSTSESFGFTFLDACALWRAVDGDLFAYYVAANDFDPATFYAARLA